jgi:hypothetical protein
MRAEQVLAETVNETEINGVTIRKGTVAAFLANARVWIDPSVSKAARTQVEADMVDALPALRAVGLFDVLEIRDSALRSWVNLNLQEKM